MTEDFSVKFDSMINSAPLKAESAGVLSEAETTVQKEENSVQSTSQTAKETPENELVVLDCADGTAYGEENILDEIQSERSAELDKYLEYQEKVAELRKEKSKYEAEIRQNGDNPETVRRYQTKLENIEAEIGEFSKLMAECEQNMQNLAAEFNKELSNIINQSAMQSLSSSVQSAYPVNNAGIGAQNAQNAWYVQNSGGTQGSGASTAGAQASTSLGAQGKNASVINYGVYTGESIPQNLAKALDSRLGSGFSQKCENVAGYLGCNVNDLLAMMYSESGLKTTARNKSSNAVGLIQFIPSTLKSNGYTTEQVASMSAVQQLDVVADIFMKAKKMAGYGANEKIDGGTLYAINWLPAYAKNNVVAQKGGKYYSSGLDMNKDGSVTKADLSQRLQSKYNEMLRNV